MACEENKAIAPTFIDAVNRQDTVGMAEVMSPKWAAEVTSWFPDVNARWPGHHIEVTSMLAEGDQVWCRLRTSAVAKGEWLGLPPNGKPWTNSGNWFLRITDGMQPSSDDRFLICYCLPCFPEEVFYFFCL